MPKELGRPCKVSLIFQILMIMNSLNGVLSDTCILQIVIQQELKKLTKIMQKKLDFKDIKFPIKISDIHKIKKKLHKHWCLWL